MKTIAKYFHAQPWVRSWKFDLTWIVGPPLFASLAVIFFSPFFKNHTDVFPLAWFALIVGVDVAHVYSTLYRTYFDVSELKKHPTLYTCVPFACWGMGVLLYSMGAMIFWSCLAYLAVFHFVRQQYGFMMIYARSEESKSNWLHRIDKVAVYTVTLYPMVYWHTHSRDFHWFIDGDFTILPTAFHLPAMAFYILVLFAYLAKELAVAMKTKRINLPKNILLLGTTVSWYLGIVHYNSDLTFTFTNVLAHGVPYIALIWLYGNKKWVRADVSRSASPFLTRIFRPSYLALFLLLLLGIAYFEEGIWDAFVWHDHPNIFRAFNFLPNVSDAGTMAILVPLLAAPQATHYVLDGFIWRLRKGDRQMRAVLLKS